jgi:mRNA interferase RelE/StbE
MNYSIVFEPRAHKDLRALSPEIQERILKKIALLEENLTGDVKRLTNFTPDYRLRVGDWRVLFEVEDSEIVIYRILHRREVYKP